MTELLYPAWFLQLQQAVLRASAAGEFREAKRTTPATSSASTNHYQKEDHE